MARFGGMTALRAALAGMAGGLEGMGDMREQQRLEERQAMLDRIAAQERADRSETLRLAREAAVRQEQRQALDAGAIRPDMDMPGATPRTGVTRQIIGDQEFMFEPKSVVSHREKLIERRTAAPRLQWSDKYGAFVDLTKGEVVPAAGLPKPSTGTVSPRRPSAMRGTADDEALGRQMIAKYARSPKLAEALAQRFAEDPAAAQNPGLVMQELMSNPRNRQLLDAEQKAMGLAEPSRPSARRSPSSAPPGRTAAPPPGRAPVAPATPRSKTPLNSYWE